MVAGKETVEKEGRGHSRTHLAMSIAGAAFYKERNISALRCYCQAEAQESQRKEVLEPRAPSPGGCREEGFGKAAFRAFLLLSL